MPRILKAYCIGHTQPIFDPPINYQMLCPHSLGIPGEIVIDDNRFGPMIDGTSLAEYSQLFGLYELLSTGDIVADDLFLFQYRKFLSPNSGGAASTASWVKVVGAEEGIKLFPTLEQLESLSSRVLVGSLLDLTESISMNYARVHVIDDLIMFSAACARNKYLSAADIKSFATFRGLIPSPALCFIKTELFIEIMKILKETWDEYYHEYNIKREGYQRRVAGYLLERLHSHLLCKWLLDGSEPEIPVWERYVVLNK